MATRKPMTRPDKVRASPDMARSGPECHGSIFWPIGRARRQKFGMQVGRGHMNTSDQASGSQGRSIYGQGKPGVPQVHLPCHGDGLEGLNLACRGFWPLESQ